MDIFSPPCMTDETERRRARLTPLSEFERQFLVDSAEYQNDEQIQDGGGDASDRRRL